MFSGVTYFLSDALDEQQRQSLAAVLDDNGARRVSQHEATHTISLSAEPTRAVTPRWVHRSLVLGQLQQPEFYSPDPAMLFSGVVATAADLSSADLEVLSAAISSLGGQWRTALTKDVTHLFCLSTGSAKYQTAMHFKDTTGIHVLVPHWFDDSVRMGLRGLDTSKYEWPHPAVFDVFAQESKSSTPPSPSKKALYATALHSSTDLPPSVGPNNVWNGRKILLGANLDLNQSQRQAHEVDIRRCGGQVVSFTPGKEVDAVADADVYITRYRSGLAYVNAYTLGKTIGTLSWLWYVRATGRVSSPTEQLLHYPIPRNHIPKFENHLITITNYTGKDREYLKKLITVLGATFTPSMSNKNTVVIAAFLSGTKTQKAATWALPIVNHLWLEDCLSQWRELPLSNERYNVFPPGIDYGKVLAEGIRGVGEKRFGEKELQEMADEEDGLLRTPRKSRSPTKKRVRNDEVDTSAYMDMDIPLDEEGRLSMDEDEDEVRIKKRRKVSPVKRTPIKENVEPSPSRSRPKLVHRAGRPSVIPDLGDGLSTVGPSEMTDEGPEDDIVTRTPEGTPKRQRGRPRKESRSRSRSRSEPREKKSPLKEQNHHGRSRTGEPTPITPLRQVSVVLPRVTDIISNSGGNRSSKIERDRDDSPQARGKPPLEEPVPGPSKPRKKAGKPPGIPASTFSIDSVDSAGTGRASRRGAATRAEQKLREEVMPDVVSFQKEMRSGVVKTPPEAGEKEKKGVKIAARQEEEQEKERGKQRGVEEGMKKRSRGAPSSARQIVIMTTQIALSDDLTKNLTKLGGVKFTTKPGECTHLVTRSLVRTEKFLCAIACAPWIVNEKWVADCVAKKQLLPEEPYTIHDPESEKKYGFKLKDALVRAAQHPGKLFSGLTFYVTPKVPVDAKLLKNVVAAGGGTLLTQTPTVRILKGHEEDRFVISCPADIVIWRPLVESGYTIYNQELVLTGMLKQEVEWDAETNKVPGSF